MRLNGRAGQNTVEYLLMLSVVVGVVMAAGVALKHFMPSFVGKVTGQITSAVCTLASDRLDMCSQASDEAAAPSSSPSSTASSAAGAAAAAASASASAGGGAASGGAPPAGISGPTPGGGAPGFGGGSGGGLIENAPGGGGGDSSFASGGPGGPTGGFASPSLGNSPQGGAPLAPSGGARESPGGGGTAPPPGNAGTGSSNASGQAGGTAGGAAGGISAGGRPGAPGAAGSAAAGGAARSYGSPGMTDIVDQARRLTSEALAGSPTAPGELSKLWKRLKRGDLHPPSELKKREQFEASLSADEKLREAYLRWETLNAQDRKAALQRAGDDFSKAYGIDSVELVRKEDMSERDTAFEQVIHESAHRYQEDLVGQLDRGELAPADDRYLQAVLMNLNGSYYFASARGYDAYRGQPLEAHAFALEGATRLLKGARAPLTLDKDPLGDNLRVMMGGGDMMAVKKKIGIAAAMAAAFALCIGAGLFLIMKEQGAGGAGAASVGARRVSVSVRDIVPAGMTAEVHHIGDIGIGADGQLALSVFREGKAATALREAFEALKKNGALKLLVEETKEENGRQVKTSAWVDVKPEDPRYVWAVVSLLKKDYGFECEVA